MFFRQNMEHSILRIFWQLIVQCGQNNNDTLELVILLYKLATNNISIDTFEVYIYIYLIGMLFEAL